MSEVIRPIAVFDSGIGSYSIVQSIRQIADKQDIIYLADRKSFPYGNKNSQAIYETSSAAIEFLYREYDPEAILVASNIPSVMMLPELKSICPVPIYGVFPPIREALEISNTGNIGVLCVKSLSESPTIINYINKFITDGKIINVINASELVEKVETGEFLIDKAGVKLVVKKFLENVLAQYPDIDVFTLSSTHLPWLTNYFTQLYEDIVFLDPANEIIESLPLNNAGSGQIICLLTESTQEKYSSNNFYKILKSLGIETSKEFFIKSVEIPMHSR